MAKAPRPGHVKTRLARDTGAAEATRIYRALGEQLMESLAPLQARHDARVVACVSPAPSAWPPQADAYWPQGAGKLGTRMSRMVGRALSETPGEAVLVGCDVVGITAARVDAACAALRAGADAALAPTPDGGYGLLALKAPQEALFRGIPWGSAAVLRATRQAAQVAGLRLALLPAVRDVDTLQDLPGSLPQVSVLVPTLNEAPHLAACMASLRDQAPKAGAVEWIVCDGGSTDGTPDLARSLGARVVTTAAGRGVQLRAAAEKARGTWLLTLHADARCLPGTWDALAAYCERAPRPWGWCETAVQAGQGVPTWSRTFDSARARLFRLPYGDQGLFVLHRLYREVGGYAPLPLFEDVDLVRRLLRRSEPACTGGRLQVSTRGWKRRGWARTTLRNWSYLASYLTGVRKVDDLHAGYAGG